MFIKEFQGWPLEGAATLSMKCPNCGNTTEHYVHVAPVGFQVGVIFSKKSLFGKRRFFLACPTCDNLTKELSKQQAHSMRT